MRVRALNVSGDWLFGKGTNDYLQNQNAIAQNIQTRLNSFLGDCFFDLGAGIDWFTLLGSKNQSQLLLNISSVITNTEGVTAVQQLSANLNPVNRNLVVSYQVATVYSIISSSLDFNINEYASS